MSVGFTIQLLDECKIINNRYSNTPCYGVAICWGWANEERHRTNGMGSGRSEHGILFKLHFYSLGRESGIGFRIDA